MDLPVPDDALAALREVVLPVEGTCEAWTDDDVVRKVLVRGALDYGKSAGLAWDARAALAKRLRAALES